MYTLLLIKKKNNKRVRVRGQGNWENKFKQEDQKKLHTSKSRRHLNKRTIKRFTHSSQEIKGSNLWGDIFLKFRK